MKNITYLVIYVSLLFAATIQATEMSAIELKGHTNNVAFVAFSPDGKKIVTVSPENAHYGGSVRIWDADSGIELHMLRGSLGGSITSAAFAPDSKRIVVGGSGYRNTGIIELTAGNRFQALQAFRQSASSSIAFSPDGRKIATGNRILDAASGSELQTLRGAHPREPYSLVFSPDGRKLVTADRGDRAARVWDVESGRELQKLEGHTENVRSVAFSPDGRKIVTAGNGQTAIIWDAESGRELKKLELEGSSTRFAAFFLDGKTIVTAGWMSIRFWDIESGKVLQTIGEDRGIMRASEGVDSVAISPDGRKMATAGSNIARILDISALPAQWADTKKRWESEQTAGNFILDTERRKSGFNNINEFLQFGSTELKDRLESAERNVRSADAFDRADAQAKVEAVRSEIETAKAEIAQKTFYDEYTYSAPDNRVQIDGDRANFVMEIPTEFTGSKIDEVLFPMQNVVGEFSSSRLGTALTVSGSTNDVRELVRNRGNYRARVWFTNLRYEDGRTFADVLKIELINIETRDTQAVIPVPEQIAPVQVVDRSQPVQPSPVPEVAPTPVEPAVQPTATERELALLERLEVLEERLQRAQEAQTQQPNNPPVPPPTQTSPSTPRPVPQQTAYQFQPTAAERAEIDSFFARHGRDARAKDSAGRTLLHKALMAPPTYGASIAVIRFLVSEGADVNAKMFGDTTTLHFAVLKSARESLERVEFLVSQGANVNAKNDSGSTPLHSSSHIDVVRFLVSKGADIHARNRFGYTPLHRGSIGGGNAEVTRFLVSQGANVHARTNNGQTPLHQAAINGDVEVARVLVSAGADATARDNNGHTPLDVARQVSREGIPGTNMAPMIQFLSGISRTSAPPRAQPQAQQQSQETWSGWRQGGNSQTQAILQAAFRSTDGIRVTRHRVSNLGRYEIQIQALETTTSGRGGVRWGDAGTIEGRINADGSIETRR